MFSKSQWKLSHNRRSILLIVAASLCTIVFYLTKDVGEQQLGFATRESRREIYSNLEKRLPQAIILGCRKSGTRALLRFLEVNPAIRAAKREVHFFDRPHNYKLGLDWYRNQMPGTRPGEMTVEKSPAYFVTKDVPERIKAMNSSIKLVVIFRNPVTRLVSDYSQIVANKLEAREGRDESKDYYKDVDDDKEVADSRVVGQTNEEIIWRKAEKDFQDYVLRADGGINDQRRAVQIGMYSVYLEKWLSVFPPGQMHFVDGEQLIVEPFKVLEKLERFLNLTPQIKSEHFVFDRKKGFFCLNATSLVGRTTGGVDSHTQTIHERHCLSKSKGRRHVKLSKQVAEKLWQFYKPYNEYLYTLTGINFNDNSASET